VKRHAFDPLFFVLGLAFAAVGLFFLVGDRTAADVGWEWIWPVAVAVLGLLFVISAGRRLLLAEGRANTPPTEQPASASEDEPPT
jgi:hypothetical protein